jgi:hypothetical protein
MCRSLWNENWQGKPKCSGKHLPSAAILSITEPLRRDLGTRAAEIGQASNSLNYVKAVHIFYIIIIYYIYYIVLFIIHLDNILQAYTNPLK